MADSEVLTFVIDDNHINRRLDAFLAESVEGWTRSRLQRLIENEDVLVNTKPSKSSYKLRKGDEVEVELTTSTSASFTPEDIPLNIVYEDDQLAIINKPSGLVVHPAAGVHSGTLANGLAFHFQMAGVGPVARPGIVHRLDRDTSGLMVVAKTESALEHLSDQFRARTVFKSYVALVHGRVDSDRGRIDQPIGRDLKNRIRMAVVRNGRSALSLYSVRRRFERFTLLDVDLKTGRTHQIRVHLAWLRHPVVGDETYGAGRDNTVQDARFRAHIKKLGRQFLHAEKLSFNHPTNGQRMEFRAELPEELSDLIQQIESN